jgi:hypothetical protein
LLFRSRNGGDYVYIDANPADRPYLGAKPDEFFAGHRDGE